jgi:hypothetical protein
MVTQSEYQAVCAAAMLEKDLQESVREMAMKLGYLVYHTHDSRRSEPGYPDLTIVGHGRLLVRELKRQSDRLGRVTPKQREWLAALADAGVDAGVWRPADLLSGQILDELKGAAVTGVGTKSSSVTVADVATFVQYSGPRP